MRATSTASSVNREPKQSCTIQSMTTTASLKFSNAPRCRPYRISDADQECRQDCYRSQLLRCQPRERPELRKLTEKVFTELEDILVSLYETHQMRLVREFGICFYGVKDHLGVYRKRFSKHKHNKPRRRRGYNKRMSTEHLLPPEEFCFHNPPIGPPWYPEKYRDVETIIYTIDNYLDSWSRGKCYRQLANSANLADPPRSFQRLEAWAILSDFCDGANILINIRAYGKARILLDRFFESLDHVFSVDDLSLISMFWRLCLQLRGIEHRWQQSEVLHRLFFEKVKHLILNHDEKEMQSLFVIASSMCNVSKDDFKDALRICFFKTVNTLLAIVGDDNSSVLHLLCLYYDHFDRGYRTCTQKDNLMKKLYLIRDRAYRSANEDAIINAEYNIVYAAHNVCGYYSVAIHHADKLFKLTARMSFAEIWTPAARAFFLAVKLLGSSYHFHGDLDKATSYLEEGIRKLDTAGNEHRIRACKLSSALETYFKQQNQFDKASREEIRRKRLLTQIIGQQMCLRCERLKESKPRRCGRCYMEPGQLNEQQICLHCNRLNQSKPRICGRCYMELGQPKKPRKKRYRAMGITKLQAKEVRAALVSLNLEPPLEFYS